MGDRISSTLIAVVMTMCVSVSGEVASGNTRPAQPFSDRYVADYVSTAATGVTLNAAGDIAGTSYPDTGCGWQCLPPIETVAWRNGVRIVLPLVPGFSSIAVRGMNANGWIVGYAGLIDSEAHAVVWKPQGNSYQAIDIGVLPGTTISSAVGIDDTGRVIGYSSTRFFPPTGAPFMWSEATGMIDLSQQGFPNEAPLAISPGGTVALSNRWYRLDDPGSVVTMVSQPSGFYPPGNGGVAINDSGDQARFLNSTSSENLAYLFRYHHEGSWQQVGFGGNGHLRPFGIGSINTNGDMTATDQGQGVIAYGPDRAEQSLTSLLSPAYQGSEVTIAGPMNSRGQILAQVMIGRSQRLVRLTPAQMCPTICMKVKNLQITGEFIDDPHDPGHCTPDAKVHVVADVQITTSPGTPLSNVLVRGHFMDDYWLNEPASAVTNSSGIASLVHDGLACTGAVAFLADGAVPTHASGPKGLDRTTGILTGYVIPLP